MPNNYKKIHIYSSASVMLIFSMLTGFIFIDLTIKAGFNQSQQIEN